jgi:hypothetical protein
MINDTPFPIGSAKILPCATNSDISNPFYARLIHRPDDGDSILLWTVGLLQRGYTALYLKMLSSSKWPVETVIKYSNISGE